MEGSRNERAVIVTTAYVIGFATAFIAFGVSQVNLSHEFAYVPTDSVSASVATATRAASDAMLTLTESGLVYKVGESETLISATTEAGGVDGAAVSITQFELSPNQKFVYFCEQPVADAVACKPFVYDVAHEVVIPLTQNGERVALSTAVATIVWNEPGITSVDGVAVDPLPVL